MQKERFETFVDRVIDNLPPEFQSKLDNVDVIVEDWPNPAQLRQAGLSHRGQLLGLYHGVPQTQRTRGYGMVLPDKISIFQKSIEAQCRTAEEVEVRIGEVVRHEIAHHFGTDERTIRKIENEWRKKSKH